MSETNRSSSNENTRAKNAETVFSFLARAALFLEEWPKDQQGQVIDELAKLFGLETFDPRTTVAIDRESFHALCAIAADNYLRQHPMSFVKKEAIEK